MPARIWLQSLENSFVTFEVNEEPLTIGRAFQPPSLWQYLVPDEAAQSTISRAHFEVRCSPSGSRLTNLSAGGTCLNGAPLSAGELHDGDVISAGCVEGAGGSRPALQLKVCRTAPTFRCDPEAKTHRLSCLQGPPGMALFPGSGHRLRVGRSMQAPDFWAALVPEEHLRNAISREHFEILFQSKPVLKNLSLAGTLLNGQLVQQQQKVHDGDVVAIPFHGRVHEAPPIVQFRVELPDKVSKFNDLFGSQATSNLQPIFEQVADDMVVSPAIAALPPPFSLHVISAAGDVGRLPRSLRILEAPLSKAQLAVGKDFQDDNFWCNILPPQYREQLLPCHFQMSISHGDDKPILLLRGMANTEVNNVPIDAEVPVSHNDVVSIRPTDAAPLVSFRRFQFS